MYRWIRIPNPSRLFLHPVAKDNLSNEHFHLIVLIPKLFDFASLCVIRSLITLLLIKKGI